MANEAGDGQHAQEKSPPRRSCYQAWFEDWWMWELFAVLGSIGLTVCLCVLLRLYDGRPVPTFDSFVHSDITLATAVALLVTLAVALALVAICEGIGQLKWTWYARGISRPLTDVDVYDKASRGSLGSLQLLWRLGVAMPVGSLGALLVLVHLAVVPLAQQAVRTVAQDVPDSSNTNGAKIPWTYYYLDRGGSFVASGENKLYANVGIGMKGAILNGLFTNPKTAVEHVQPLCSSGNCTFDDYFSLAVCASRADVSSHLKKQKSGYCLPGNFCLYTDGIDAPTANNAFHPDPLPSVTAYVNITSAATNDLNSEDDTVMTTDGDPLDFSSVAFTNNNNNSIADFYIIYLNNTNSADQPAAAMEVLFEWCIPRFSTNVAAGVATTVRHANPHTKFDFYIPDDDPFAQLEANQNRTHYNIPLSTHFSLQRWIQLVMSGSVYSNASATSLGSREAVQALVDPLNLTTFWDKPGLSYAVGAWDMTDLDQVLTNTATSMTNFVRTTWMGTTTLDRGTNQTLVESRHINGTVLTQRPIVQVSWGWLVAPVAFVLMTTLFFLLVVVSGYRRPPVWKTNSLAIARGLDPDLQRALGPIVAGSHQLSQTSQGVLVSLVYDAGGWRLIPQHAPVMERDGLLLHAVPPAKMPVVTHQVHALSAQQSSECVVYSGHEPVHDGGYPIVR